ncbi:type II secretion system F family protein [Viridibacillus arvi]|uniref:type II secretion system F family protein n=1 Tax=Viridibacillus arvi TaxID=263475 RepID=UPI0034CFD23E
MRILDSISFQSIFLIIGGVAFFVLLLILFSGRKKTYRAARMLNKSEVEFKKKKGSQEQVIQQNALDLFFEKTKLLAKFSPYNVIIEARSIEWKIGYKEYTGIFLAGAVALSALFYVYLGKTFMSVYIGLFAIIGPRIVLHYKRLQYQMNRRDRISIFMKSIANSMSVFGNAIDAIEEVMPLVHESLRSDLVKAVALLKSGKALSFSFSSLLEKYSYQDLHFFIDMLEVAHEHGGEYNDLLSNIADDFDQTKLLHLKLSRAMALAKKAFYQNGIFVATLPIIFLIAEHGQLYKYLTSGYLDGILGMFVMCLNFVIVCFFWHKLEKIAKFDLDGE